MLPTRRTMGMTSLFSLFGMVEEGLAERQPVLDTRREYFFFQNLDIVIACRDSKLAHDFQFFKRTLYCSVLKR